MTPDARPRAPASARQPTSMRPAIDPADIRPTHFRWQVADRVATVTLDRPERKNPLTFDSYDELRNSFYALNDAREVKVVVIRGAGGNFCSGGDVHEIIGPLTERGMPGLLDFTRMTGDLVKAMRGCPQPIVAAIDGVCVGAGAIIAMASDIRIATPETKTAFLFTRVGLAGCDMGACAILPRIIGHGRAAELLFTGRSMGADEGLAWGFWNRITDNPLEDAQALARDLARGPTLAHAVTKRQLDAEWHVSIEEALDMEAVAQAELMQTNDFKRAYQAFSGKHQPVFRGD